MAIRAQKSYMNQSSFTNRYLNWELRENVLAFRKTKSICNSLNKKKDKRDYFKRAYAEGVMGQGQKKSLQSSEIPNGNIKEGEKTLSKEFKPYFFNHSQNKLW